MKRPALVSGYSVILVLSIFLFAPHAAWACISISPYAGYQEIFLKLGFLLTIFLFIVLPLALFVTKRLPRLKKTIRYFLFILVVVDMFAFGVVEYFGKKNQAWYKNQTDATETTKRLDC